MCRYIDVELRFYGHSLAGWLIALSVVMAVVVADRAAGQATVLQDQSAERPVELQWKFVAGQVFQLRFVKEESVENREREHKLLIVDFNWTVQSVDNRGTALVEVKATRVRFGYRNGEVAAEYDSLTDKQFDLPGEEHAGAALELTLVTQWLDTSYQIRVSRQGSVNAEGPATTGIASPLAVAAADAWPLLPATPVRPGDTWPADDTSKAETSKLVKLERVEGGTIAWIESNRGVSRFAVERGRFLDGAMHMILSVGQEPGNDEVMTLSVRKRLSEQGPPLAVESGDPVQNIPVKLAQLCFYRSARSVSKITEYLADERELLNGVVSRLYVELADPTDIPAPSDKWTPMDWLMIARLQERAGTLDDTLASLHRASGYFKGSSAPGDYLAASILMQVSERLAQQKDFAGARQAALAISPLANEGLNVTSQGPVEVPEASMQGYALLLTVRSQLQAGDYTGAAETAEMIVSGQARAAAYWLAAGNAAETGDVATAERLATLAAQAEETIHRSTEEAESVLLEFTHEGPSPVPLGPYRLMALSGLATRQICSGDNVRAERTLANISNHTEQELAIAAVVISLERCGNREAADEWIKSVPEPLASIVSYFRAQARIAAGDIEGARAAVEATKSADYEGMGRIELSRALARTADRGQLETQLALARKAVDSLENPGWRLGGLLKIADLQSAIGDQARAVETLQSARKEIEASSFENDKKTSASLALAQSLAKAGAMEEYRKLVESIRNDAKSLDKFPQSEILVDLVQLQVDVGEPGPAEELAAAIPEAAFRCQALVAVGQFHAENLELVKSRELFAQAMAAAKDVFDFMGLDTVHSKGGALRSVGRQQARCDFNGLMRFLEASSDPNVLAYGYLGAAEAVDPTAAANADRRSSWYPKGLLGELWANYPLSEIVHPSRSPNSDISPN